MELTQGSPEGRRCAREEDSGEFIVLVDFHKPDLRLLNRYSRRCDWIVLMNPMQGNKLLTIAIAGATTVFLVLMLEVIFLDHGSYATPGLRFAGMVVQPTQSWNPGRALLVAWGIDSLLAFCALGLFVLVRRFRVRRAERPPDPL